MLLNHSRTRKSKLVAQQRRQVIATESAAVKEPADTLSLWLLSFFLSPGARGVSGGFPRCHRILHAETGAVSISPIRELAVGPPQRSAWAAGRRGVGRRNGHARKGGRGLGQVGM